MTKVILITCAVIVLFFAGMVWYGSTIPDETYAQKVAKIEQVCKNELDPSQCELTEVARVVDQQQQEHQRYLDSQVDR